MTLPRIVSTAGGSTVEVRLVPRSSRRGPGPVRSGALELKVNAPPVDGKANVEARKLLADLLGVAPSSVSLKRGRTSKQKVFFVEGLSAAEARRRFEKCLDRNKPKG